MQNNFELYLKKIVFMVSYLKTISGAFIFIISIVSIAQVLTQEERFMNAVTQGDITSVEALIENGVDINFRHDETGLTALMLAVFASHKDIVDLLVEKRIKIESKDNNGWTSLMWTVSLGNRDLIKFLLDSYADIDLIDLADNDNVTPLMLSISVGYGEIAELLVERGADLNLRDRHGSTPLILAAIKGDESTVRLLAEKGADINAKDERGVTALLYAFLGGHLGIVQLLLQLGADPPPDFDLVPFIGRSAALIAN